MLAASEDDEATAMQLTADQLKRFHEDGFLILPNLFSKAEVAALTGALPRLFAEDTPANFCTSATRPMPAWCATRAWSSRRCRSWATTSSTSCR